MPVTTTTYGTLPDGRKAGLFRLDGGEGVTASITNFGGVITSLRAPDRAGRDGEIGLGLPSLADYAGKNSYYGALVGRIGNRLAGARFSLDGKEYKLFANNGPHHLHGGKEGFNRKLWKAETTNDGVRLTYLSPDGEEGYPGALSVTVEYALRGRELSIDYAGVTDAPTIVNLTNHEFFNLNCCADTIMKHELRIAAGLYTPVDDTLIPTGEIANVSGTPFDFQTMKPVGRDAGRVPGGYDHNFVFADARKAGDWLAEVFEPTSGRTLEMSTTEPCVQFYAGNSIPGTETNAAGIKLLPHYGFCLEAQKHPNAINQPGFANMILRPGETYRQTTVYRFGAR